MLRYLLKTVYLSLDRRINRFRYRCWHPGANSKGSPRGLLTYHTICDRESIPFSLRGEVVRESDFAGHLQGFLEAGFRFMNLRDWISKSMPPHTVVLTFDDGYAGVFQRVYPLLERYGLPATLFLATDFINRRVKPPWDSLNHELREAFSQTAPLWAPLRWEEIRCMADGGRLEIGSHGCGHRRMGLLPLEEVKKELLLSKEEIEQRIGRPVLTFSFPFGIGRYGAFGPHLEAELRNAGYIAACTGEEGRPTVHTNPFFLPRFPIRLNDSAVDVEARILGLADWSSHCQHFFHHLFRSPHVD
jgi:peptidoglycan/xylan/chitin deacetylase (PgdA/CDA1 family)